MTTSSSMRRLTVLLAAPLILVVAAFSQGLHGAYDSEASIDSWTDFDTVRQRPEYRVKVLERFATDVAASEWRTIFDELATDFRNAPRSADPAGGAAQATFAKQVDALAEAFVRGYEAATSEGRLRGEPDRDDELARVLITVNRAGFGAATFTVRGKVAPPNLPLASPRAALFADAADPRERPGEILFTSYDPQGAQVARLPLDVAIDLRLRADAIESLFAQMTQGLRDKQTQMLDDAAKHWEAYLEDGYSQYPWEEWLNGFEVNPSSIEPPRWQWIALHPSAAVELDVSGFDDLRIGEALNLELFGRLRYDRDFEDFHGASLSLLVRDDIGPGFGATVHVNRTFNLGVAWHDVDDDGDWFDEPPFVFCSLDLFRLVEKRAPELRRRMHDAVEALPPL